MAQNSNRNKGESKDEWDLDDGVDLDNVPTRGDVETGRYLWKVTQHEKRDSNNGEKTFFSIGAEIIDVEDEKLKASIGAKVYDLFNINIEAVWKLKSLMKACGLPATGNKIPNLTGLEFVADVEEETWDGKKNWRWRRFKSPEEYGWSGLNETRSAADVKEEKKDTGKKTDTKKIGSGGGGKAEGGGEVEI